MTKSYRFMAALSVFIATTLAAGERIQSAAPVVTEPNARMREEAPPPHREAPLLLYALPAVESNGETLVEIRFVRGKEQLIQQLVALTPGTRGRAVLALLFTVPDELTKLRAIEADTPGSLRVLVRANGKLVDDQSFAAIELRSATLSATAAAGELREIRTFVQPKERRIQAQGYDPDCIYWCDVQFNSCMEWCDPRGSDCNQCYTWYHDCSIQCPYTCDEYVTTETVRTPITYTYQGSECLHNWNQTPLFGQWWHDYSVYTRTDTYQRTHHCDGSYTDTYLSTSYSNIACQQSTNVGCGPSTGLALYNSCP